MVLVSRSPGRRRRFGADRGLRAARARALRGAQRRRASLRELWPEVVDNLASAVRAGLSLPEALAQVGVRGPEQLRPAVRSVRRGLPGDRPVRRLPRPAEGTLADPVGDRVVESLRIAREVGGSDLGRLLRTLSAFLREDARTRAELEARQSWTVNAARLAVAAPWLVLALLSFQPEASHAYNTPAGALVLLVVAASACSPTG